MVNIPRLSGFTALMTTPPFCCPITKPVVDMTYAKENFVSRNRWQVGLSAKLCFRKKHLKIQETLVFYVIGIK